MQSWLRLSVRLFCVAGLIIALCVGSSGQTVGTGSPPMMSRNRFQQPHPCSPGINRSTNPGPNGQRPVPMLSYP